MDNGFKIRPITGKELDALLSRDDVESRELRAEAQARAAEARGMDDVAAAFRQLIA